MVADGDRDRALEVRVPGHRRLGLVRGAVEDRPGERAQQLVRLLAGRADGEPEGGSDLVVAGAAGVELAPDLAELALDRAVDVLVALVDAGDRIEPAQRLGELVVVEDPGRVQPPRVEPRRLEVVRQELEVVAAQERPHRGRELRLDPCGPERHHVHPSVSSIRRESAMSFTCTASWPMRSVAVKAVALRSIESRSGS